MGEKTYKDIAIQYVCYVSGKYGGGCCIVFDGYEQGLSIKSDEHRRRHTKSCANVQVKEYLEACHSQQNFLSNETNKSQFIKLLSLYLEDDALKVKVMLIH